MTGTHRTKSPVQDPDGALLFIRFETMTGQTLGSGALSAVLAVMSAMPWKLVYVEASEYSSHLQVTAELSLSRSTTETDATAVMQALSKSIESACERCKIEEMHGILAPGLSELRSLVSKP